MSTSHYSSLYLVICSCCLFATPTAKGVTCTGLNWQIYYNMLCSSDSHCKNVITKLRVSRKIRDQKLVSVFRCSPFSCASQYKLTSAIAPGCHWHCHCDPCDPCDRLRIPPRCWKHVTKREAPLSLWDDQPVGRRWWNLHIEALMANG